MHGFLFKNVRNLWATPQCDRQTVRSFLDYPVSFSMLSAKKVRSISGLCLARDCTFFDTIRFNLIVHSLTQSIRFLTFFDTIRFCRSLALFNGRTESKSKIKNERQLFLLRRDRFGNALSNTTKHFLNLLDYVLSDSESFVLSHGLNFGLPSRYLCKEEFFVEFESLWAQPLHRSASSITAAYKISRLWNTEAAETEA